MKTIRTASLLMLPLFAVIVFIGSQAANAQTKKVTYYSIKAGTVFHVRIETSLSSKSARVGDKFETTVEEPVYSSRGVELVPSGSKIYGKVTSATPAQKDGKPGTIDVSFYSLVLPNGRRATISGSLSDLTSGETRSDDEGTISVDKTKNRNLKFIGGGAAGGAVIGGIAGGGKGAVIGGAVGAVGGLIGKKMSKGDEAEVKKGTEFGVYLNRAISLPKYR